MKRLTVEKLATRDGPYSHIAEVGDTVYLSGIIAHDNPKHQNEPGSIEEETAICLDIVSNLLNHIDLKLENVSSVVVHMTDLKEFDAMNTVYQRYFPLNFQPVRTCVGVSSLLSGARIEITCTATRPAQ